MLTTGDPAVLQIRGQEPMLGIAIPLEIGKFPRCMKEAEDTS